MKANIIGSIFILILIFSLPVISQVRLPQLVSDGMVLQRDSELKVWGWASKGEDVTVKFNGTTLTAKADNEGKWIVLFPSMEAGGPFEMEIKGINQITVSDILIGDVWLCSGQSNMELTMERASPLYQDIIKNSENSQIRYFNVPDRYNFKAPQHDLESGSWQSAHPSNILNFSAVAYFFARELFEKYQVPIGLINASLGGSPVEAWLSEEALKEFPLHFEEAQKFKEDKLIKKIESSDQARSNAWYQELRNKDLGFKNPKNPWYKPSLKDADWSVMKVPGFWEDELEEPVDGVVWFRKEIEIPASMVGKPAKLLLGRIVDSDSVYVNGKLVGTTGYQYPPRRYDIDPDILKEGKNTIVVRIINNAAKGGFIKDKDYQISAGGEKIDLKGDWKYKVGARMQPLEGPTFIRWKPVGLYNGMIAPLLNYVFKAVIWYQGESNADEAEEYNELFSAMILDWRRKFEQEKLPFLFVQLANFIPPGNEPEHKGGWPELREAQLETLDIPNTGMAVAIDIGEWNDIHPLNKEDVGKRLALAAQKIAYGEDVVYSGPLYQSMKIKGKKAILSFTHIGSGLAAKGGGDLKHFEIAGKDGQFVSAKATIKDDKVVVWNEDVSNPVAVRYAWAHNPEGANLYNEEGLPASPFRTEK